MRTMIPIHDDRELDEEWLKAHGFELSINCWYNSIRDASGRYDGFCLLIQRKHVCVRSRAETEKALRGESIDRPVELRPALGDDPEIEAAIERGVAEIQVAEDEEWLRIARETIERKDNEGTGGMVQANGGTHV